MQTCKSCGTDRQFCEKENKKKHSVCGNYTARIKRPKCCNECARYDKDPDEPGTGYCDEWLGVKLKDEWICHPNIGIKGKPHMLKSRKKEQ